MMLKIRIVCNIVKTHLESKSQQQFGRGAAACHCVQYSKNTFRKQITTQNVSSPKSK